MRATPPPAGPTPAPDRVDPEEASVSLTARVQDPDDTERFTYEWSGDVPARTQEWRRTEDTHNVEFGDEVGTYVAEVTVTDRLGSTDTATHEFFVGTEGDIPTVMLRGPAEVSLDDGGTAPYLVSVSGANGQVVDYTWRRDGEVVDDGRNASITFGTAGETTVSVTVEDEAGFIVTDEMTVNVVGSEDEAPEEPGDGSGGIPSPLRWVTSVSDPERAAATELAPDALDLSVFKCNTAEARADLGQLRGRLEVSFDWTVEAEGWYERPEMLVIEDGDIVHNAGGQIRKEESGTTTGSTSVSVPVDGSVEVVFQIVPSSFCGNPDHQNTLFEVRNIDLGLDAGPPGLAVETQETAPRGPDGEVTFTQRRAIDPLRRESGGETIEEFYGHNTGPAGFSVNTPTGIARNDTAELFVYDGPNGPSLVLILGYRDSGSASVDFDGVPAAAEWVVADDSIGGITDNYNGTSSVDWDWSPNRSDGGALRGGFDDAFEVTVTIESAFGLSDLDVLSGQTADASNPERIGFDRSESVTIRRL